MLDLPSGSQAVSPTICVDNTYPTARTEVRNVIGAEGVQFYVSYAGTKTWSGAPGHRPVPRSADELDAVWLGQPPAEQHPGLAARAVHYVPGGKNSDFQIYNFLVDPRCRG